MKLVLKTRPAKIIIWILAILFAICIAAVAFYLIVVPFGTTGYDFHFGCVEITDDGFEIPPGRVSHSFSMYNNYVWNLYDRAYLARLAVKLESIQYEKTEDIPTDIELFQFDFENYKKSYGYSTTKSYIFAYDFYLKKVYTIRANVWYVVKGDYIFNKFIEYCMNIHYPDSFDERWRGQSLYGHEEFRFDGNRFDFENPTFRYNLYWSWKDEMKARADFWDYRDNGFINTDAVSITTKEEAIVRAAKELGFENPVGFVFYDKTCGYWMVELYDDKGIEPAWNNEYTLMLAEEAMTVIMDNNGITLEVFNSVTSYYQFIRDYEKTYNQYLT